ncbi:cAMP-specific phosphodiesterase, putative [Babesia caballi]|uniref:cAMP-specific phosphodiesterase, putative n=1 Tax=Babesia caballi TaxID=5871 RepID=A0AAV4M3F4_BABCB|nr:cAMP-specific phosphodiesterase, putative [Babesia caballi]
MEGIGSMSLARHLERRNSSSGSIQNSERTSTSSEMPSADRQMAADTTVVQRYDLSALTKEQLLVLMCFSNAIMSQSLPVKCILMTLKALKTNLGAEFVEICYPDKESSDWVVHSVGKDGVLHKKNLPKPTSGAYHNAFVYGTLVRIDSCADSPIYDRGADKHTEVELRNLLVCPLVDSKKLVWGVAGIANCTESGVGRNDYQMHYSVSTPMSELVSEARQNSDPAAVPSGASSAKSLSSVNSFSFRNSFSSEDLAAYTTTALSEVRSDHGSMEAASEGGFPLNGVCHVWDESTVTFALQICDIGGQCISNAIGWRQLDATRDKADGLLTLMHSLFADRLGIQSCVVALTTHARKLIQAERCTVYIVDRSHDQLWSISSDDGSQVVVPLSRGCASACVANGEVIVIENACEDARFEPEFDSRAGVEIRNVAWVPIKSSDCNRVLAVIEVINKQAEELLHFGEDDLRLLEIFSAIVGPQLERSDFAVSVSRPAETEAGLAFKTVPQVMVSVSRQHIAEPCIPETEEE